MYVPPTGTPSWASLFPPFPSLLASPPLREALTGRVAIGQFVPHNGTFDPQGPNATCVSVTSLTDQQLGPCAYVVRTLFTEYYSDENQPRRELLGRYLTHAAPPIPLLPPITRTFRISPK